MMSNTTRGERCSRLRIVVPSLLLTILPALTLAQTGNLRESPAMTIESSTSQHNEALDLRQQAIAPIGALSAAGDMARLGTALNQGLDAGMTVSDAREILLQLYAYAGFPRSLNALAELMKVLEARRQRGIQDAPGREPNRSIPMGEELLATGTANQTLLSGGLVDGPLFDFAPVANQYLRSHLFGAIFERDNLDWQSRELATIGMLSALPGADAQLQAHIRIGMNTGLTEPQLRHLARTLDERADVHFAQRVTDAMDRQLASTNTDMQKKSEQKKSETATLRW